MIKYRCPSCGAACNKSYCYDCERDIPLSQRFDDNTESDPTGAFTPSSVSVSASATGYKCPNCGAFCKTSHCYDCDKDLPMSAKYSSSTGWHSNRPTTISHPTGFDKQIGNLFSIDRNGKRFKIKGENNFYSFDELVNYELCENNYAVQKGGVGRALVGGALFGDTGAIVGAATRKSASVVDSLYIRLTLKSVGMRKISLIDSQTLRDGFVYKSLRKMADEIVSELDLITAENQRAAAETVPQTQPTPPPQAEPAPTMIADELLKLKQLLDMGVLSEEEFNQQKQKLLNR